MRIQTPVTNVVTFYEERHVKVLFNGGKKNGVRVFLTEDAHEALYFRAEYFKAHGSYKGCDPIFLERIIAGTLTFVSLKMLRANPSLERYHTGSFEMGYTLARLLKVKGTELTVAVPFADGNEELFEELLAKGYGPRLELVHELLTGEPARAIPTPRR